MHAGRPLVATSLMLALALTACKDGEGDETPADSAAASGTATGACPGRAR